MLPFLNDGEGSLDAVGRAAAAAGAMVLAGHPVFIKPCARAVFLPFLEERFPHLGRWYRDRLDSRRFPGREYARRVAERLERVRKRYGLGTEFPEHLPAEWPDGRQLELPFGAMAGPELVFSAKSTC
jgi:hypothetical protein